MKRGWRWVWPALAGAVLLSGLLTVDTSPVGAQEESEENVQSEDRRFDNGYCLGCHDSETSGISLSDVELPSGEVLDITVERETYQFSVHGRLEMSCVLCHTDISEYPHAPIEAQNLREYAVANYAACATCHDAQYTATHDNVHGTALLNGNNEAAVCTDCHGAHNVQPAEKRGTAIQQTCENCHYEIYTVYEESVHGAALFEEGNADVPTCTDCHGVHDVEGPGVTGFHLFSPQICADCHEDENLMGDYGISTEVFDTYVSDFHGTTVVIFEELSPDQETNKPVCIDCHGVHNIASADDPESQTFRENLLGTCQRCHPDATANFPTSWLSHYQPTRQDTPLVFYVNLFYRILIPVVIGGMVLWVLIDFIRKLAARRREVAGA
ncbi:MAG: cytochrome c3 family protein [Acidimicrobiia bacterium]|nr:cytochrome c3 family protein [Acidimicrobiia bacterium]